MDVLKWVFEQVKQRSRYRVNIDDPETYDGRDSTRNILQVALQNLENARKYHRVGLPQRDPQVEDDRIDDDFKEFRIRVTKRFPKQHEAIKVYNMEDPTSPPCVIAGMLH
jgi:23S rRNA G2445 N2-methylase RlmL